MAGLPGGPNDFGLKYRKILTPLYYASFSWITLISRWMWFTQLVTCEQPFIFKVWLGYLEIQVSLVYKNPGNVWTPLYFQGLVGLPGDPGEFSLQKS